MRKQEMNYFMENHQLREEYRADYPDGVYTLDLIRDGKRFGSTRGEVMGKIGETIILFNIDKPEMETVKVKITDVQPITSRQPAEAEVWSKKEGWSAEFFIANDNLDLAFQTSFELVD
jgi:hypothetical protein